MRRTVPPSVEIEEKIDRLLAGGIAGDDPQGAKLPERERVRLGAARGQEASSANAPAFDTYVGVFKEFDPTHRVTAEEAIAEARSLQVGVHTVSKRRSGDRH